MLHIYKGVDNNLIFTGLELAVLTAPKYLFTFTSHNDKIVTFVGTNISTKSRYQKILVLKKIFDNQDCGTWRYTVREQASATNKDVSLSGGIVEQGFMYLQDLTGCADNVYTDQCNEFKTYNGE